jgi:mycothiol synthase
MRPSASIVGMRRDRTGILGAMRRLTQRPAGGLDDLRIAADLMSAAWQADASHVAESPAAIEWWYALSFPDLLGDHLRLWFIGSRPVAWSWHEPPELESHVWSGHPASDLVIYRAILESAITEADGKEVGAFAADDDEEAIAVLRELGFAPAGRRLSQWQRVAADGAMTHPPLRDGYRVRGLAGRNEFTARVALHRAAFRASRLTVDKYERLLTVPHYRLEDDLVVEAPDGSLAAFALSWYDPMGEVGEFEPVGTRPDHQRRGLARAVLAAGLTRLFERGARVVQVYSDSTESAAEALYATTGFRRRAFHQRHAYPPPSPAEGTIDT